MHRAGYVAAAGLLLLALAIASARTGNNSGTVPSDSTTVVAPDATTESQMPPFSDPTASQQAPANAPVASVAAFQYDSTKTDGGAPAESCLTCSSTTPVVQEEGRTISRTVFGFPLSLPDDTIEMRWIVTPNDEIKLVSSSPNVKTLADREYYSKSERRREIDKYGCLNGSLMAVYDTLKVNETVDVVIYPTCTQVTHTDEKSKPYVGIDGSIERVWRPVGKASDILAVKGLRRYDLQVVDSTGDSTELVVRANKGLLRTLMHLSDSIGSVEIYCRPSPLSGGDELCPGPDYTSWPASGYNPSMPWYATGSGVCAATCELGINPDFLAWMRTQSPAPVEGTIDLRPPTNPFDDHCQMTFYCLYRSAGSAVLYHRNGNFLSLGSNINVASNSKSGLSDEPEKGVYNCQADVVPLVSPYPLLINAAGNDGWYRVVRARQYNALSVGGVSHTNAGTPDAYYEIVYQATQKIGNSQITWQTPTCTRNPPSPASISRSLYGDVCDRELPEVLVVSERNCGQSYAPESSLGHGIQGPLLINGTSAAAPTAAGIAARVMSANPSQLVGYPLGMKVALMVTAENVFDGYWDPLVDGKDGCGVVSGYGAAEFVHNASCVSRNNSAVETGLSSKSQGYIPLPLAPSNQVYLYNVITPSSKEPGKHFRAVLTWASSVCSTSPYENLISDLQLEIVRPSDNKLMAQSYSFNSNVEVVDVPAESLTTSTPYTIRVVVTQVRQASGSPNMIPFSIGWTWVKDFAGKTVANTTIAGTQDLSLTTRNIVVGPSATYQNGSSTVIVADGKVSLKPGTLVQQGATWNTRIVQRLAAWDLDGIYTSDNRLEDLTNGYRDGAEDGVKAQGRLYDSLAPSRVYSNYLDGVSKFASLCTKPGSPALPYMTEFAVSAWVKLPDPIVNGVVFSALGTTNSHGGFYLAIENGQVKFVVEKDASASPQKNEVAYTLTSEANQALNGRWVMLTGVWSTEKRKQQLWINNLLKAENTTGILETYLTQGVAYYIGKKPSGSYFKGRVDEASVYAGMPDQKFMERLYNPMGSWPAFPGHWD